MNYSSTIVLRDLGTGAGRTGLTVKRRWQDDNYAADREVAVEVAGKPGVYQFDDLPYKKSKLWVAGAEEISFGGTGAGSGRWFPDLDLKTVFLDSDVNGHWDHRNKLIYNVLDPTTGDHVGDRDFNDARYMPFGNVQAFWWLIGNALFVDDAIGQGDVRHYKTIQAAINYRQTLADGSRWSIFIVPAKDYSVGYAEDITLQNDTNLIGLGLVKIEGTMTGANLSISLENLFWNYSGNLGVTNVKAKNSVFRTHGGSPILTVTGCRLTNCGLYSVIGANPQIVSGGNNQFLGSCYSNIGQQAASDLGILSSFDDKTIDYDY